MKRVGVLLLASFFVLLQVTNATLHAETILPASVVINEIQTNGIGSGTTLQEFIEITNVSTAQIDISGYKVVYTNSSEKSFDLTIFGIGTVINPGGFMLLVPVNVTNSFLPDISPKISYVAPSSSGVAASGGVVSLVNTAGQTLDRLQWANTQAAAVDDIVYYPGDGKSISRKLVNGQPVVTVSAKNDFELLATPTPQAGDPAPVVVPDPDPELMPDPPVDPAPVEPDPPLDPQPEVPPPMPDPPVLPVYAPILLNELLIDPVSPKSDANDEWIELFNPSDNPVDISSYAIFTGTSYSYKYVFPAGSNIAAHGYVVITSGTTPISLSNGGSAAKIVSPDAQVFDATSYVDAPAGQSWAKNSSGVWEWTTTPTEDATNIITSPLPPAIKTAAIAAAKTKPKTATTPKVTAVKAATTKTTTKPKTTTTNTFDEPALIAAPTPIPAWLLAVLVVLAVLYVAYEYRFEAANTIYRLRHYRNARR